MSAINRTILKAEEPLKLAVNDFSQAFAQVSSEFGNPKQDKQLIIELLTWFGLHVYPLAYPIAKNIENE
ncbi:hypothetical protein PUF88_06680 [Lactobacillaceae bacterium L1_55_11]|nr:hypothetical protein [Lactobacillaceae bacterium L1_55_11]